MMLKIKFAINRFLKKLYGYIKYIYIKTLQFWLLQVTKMITNNDAAEHL